MLHDLRLREEFFAELWAFDAEIAAEVAAAGCPHCGGPLYQANYERKPRGAGIAAEGEAFTLRHSLCCGREGCWRRATPPSLRFLGRKVYRKRSVCPVADRNGVGRVRVGAYKRDGHGRAVSSGKNELSAGTTAG